MGTSRITLTEDTFILGSIHPAGSVIDIDLSSIGIKSPDDTYVPPKETKPEPVPLAPNIEKAGKQDDGLGEYPVAAISPTGPNPTAPQAVPPGTTQQGEAFVSGGDAITPETTDTGEK